MVKNLVKFIEYTLLIKLFRRFFADFLFVVKDEYVVVGRLYNFVAIFSSKSLFVIVFFNFAKSLNEKIRDDGKFSDSRISSQSKND